MGNLGFVSVFLGLILFVIWAWRVVNWVWFRPRKMEKWLREQGLKGNSYRLLHGDTKEAALLAKEAKRKPIGLCDDILPRVLPFHHNIVNKYGKNSFYWVGPGPRVIVMEPELIREILVNNNVFKKPKPNPLARFLVCGLAGYEDEKWAKHRKIVNPAFYAEKLKCMIPAMQLSCSEMLDKWEKLVLENNDNSIEIDVLPYIENLTSNVISRTAFGSSFSEGRKIFSLQKEQAELTRQVLQAVYIPGLRFLPTKRNKRMRQINDELRALLRGIINKRELAERSRGEEDDLLGLLLKSNQKEIREHGNNKDVGLTINEVIEECKTFYFAGQESTSNLLAWTMVLLSMHPNWQASAREEVLEAFGNNKPDFDGLSHLKVVTMILYEVLRLYPPAIIFSRTIYQDTNVGGTKLPKGIHFLLPIILVHHDRELWGEDAKEFKPERFSEGVAKATKNRLIFFPFSGGPRICIGSNFALMEVKMALAMILQSFSFELSPSYSHAPSYVVTLQPQSGVHIIVSKI